METVEFSLAKDEIPVYDGLMNVAGYDPSVYRTKQLVESPPEHYAEVAFSFSSRKLFELLDESGDTELDFFEIVEKGIDVCEKFARSINNDGYSEKADKALVDFGDVPNETPEELEEQLKYQGDVPMDKRLLSTYRFLLSCNNADSRVEIMREALSKAPASTQ